MKCIVAISRILLGLVFIVFGLNGFLNWIPTPPLSGVAAQFMGAIFSSRFYTVVFLSQIIGGLLLLANRYVPLGLLILGPVIVNIISFHIFMSTTNLPVALVVAALWFIVFWRGRSAVCSNGLAVMSDIVRQPYSQAHEPQPFTRAREDSGASQCRTGY